MNAASWTSGCNRGMRGLLVLLIAVGLVSCGGGESTPPAPAPPPAGPQAPVSPPQIIATLTTYFSGTSTVDGIASVQVLNPATAAPISDAVVTVNDIPLPYVVDARRYLTPLQLVPGTTQTLIVRLQGATYSQSIRVFDTGPDITSPRVSAYWPPLLSNTISWEAASPSPAGYLVSFFDSEGRAVWPADSGRPLSGDTRSLTVPPDALASGVYRALVGALSTVSIASASAPSSLSLVGIRTVDFTMGTLAETVESLQFAPDRFWVEPGASTTATVLARFADGRTVDVSSLASLAVIDPARAVVQGSRITGVARGGTKLRATLHARTAETSVAVFSPAPSPARPLGRSTAFQGDAGHGGYLSFGGAPLAFPPLAHWSRTLPGQVSYPVVAGSRAFFLSEPHWLHAVDLTTGADAWGPVQVDGTYGDMKGIALDQGRLFLASPAGVHAYDPGTGDRLWSTPVAIGNVYSAPVALDGLVYVNSGRGFHAFDSASGELMWSTPALNDGSGIPVVSDGAVYVVGSCHTQKLHAYGGATLWRRDWGCSPGLGSTVALGPQGLFVREQLGQLGDPPFAILDPATGERIGRFASTAPLPALSPDGNGFFIANGALRASPSLAFLSPAWSFAGDGRLGSWGPPLVIDSTVFVMSQDGNVFAIDAPTGNQRWSTAVSVPHASLDSPLRVTAGFGAGDGWLLLPAYNTLHAWQLRP